MGYPRIFLKNPRILGFFGIFQKIANDLEKGSKIVWHCQTWLLMVSSDPIRTHVKIQSNSFSRKKLTAFLVLASIQVLQAKIGGRNFDFKSFNFNKGILRNSIFSIIISIVKTKPKKPKKKWGKLWDCFSSTKINGRYKITCKITFFHEC